jgi:hypothetical protein
MTNVQRTTRRRRETAQRRERLERIREQVAAGTLVIRQATDAEREAWEREREQREAATAASSSSLSHSPADARPQAADVIGTDSPLR